MNKQKMNCIVEYIGTQAEFPFDVLDVQENLDAVLGYFGFHVGLTEEERVQLQQDLAVIAEASEVAEMARLVGQEEESAFAGIGPENDGVLYTIYRSPKSLSPAEWMARLAL